MARREPAQPSTIQTSPWTSALYIVWIMLRNATVSIAWMWIMTYYTSRGNIFAGRPIADQSYESFLVATEIWCQLTFSVIIVLTEIVGLMKERFIIAPNRPPPFLFCSFRLGRQVWMQNLLHLAVVASSSFLIATVTPHTWRKYRIDAYLICIYCHACYTHSIIATRKVFKLETVRGADRSATRAIVAHRWQYPRLFVRVFFQHLHSGISYTCATIFVHITTEVDLTSQRSIVMYTLVSLGLKLVAQECVRYVLLRQRVNDIRTMAIAVGLPTVLIDTQVRIVLQRMQSLSFSIVGTLGMAVSEIALRIAKLVFLKIQIRRRERRLSIRPIVNTVEPLAQSTRQPTSSSQPAELPSIPPDDWNRRVQTYHVAELYADMLAEYIAAGSALAIVGFYWNHPKYFLHRATTNEDIPSDSQYGINTRQFVVFATQIGIEIIVDYVSCVITIGSGIGFAAITRYATFISAVFITMASFNMQISALMYLDTDV